MIANAPIAPGVTIGYTAANKTTGPLSKMKFEVNMDDTLSNIRKAIANAIDIPESFINTAIKDCDSNQINLQLRMVGDVAEVRAAIGHMFLFPKLPFCSPKH